MDDPRDEILVGEESAVFRWRMEQFLRLGFDEVRAEFLALSPAVDLHYVKDLLDRGCSHDHAHGIVT